VVVNDGGGAIFVGLEHGLVAERDGMGPVVERFFGTPQEVDVRSLCAAYGLEWLPVDSEDDLQKALGGSPGRGRRVLELRSDRTVRPEVRRLVASAVRATFR
jgi:2-succinyl-5-enolpyruvyl-6-hydroxy-3-cyclohexene-1-carboxylate synthase